MSKRSAEYLPGLDGLRAVAVASDLAAEFARRSAGESDPALRPVGVHFTQATARQVADWLGPQLVSAVASMTSR